MKSVNFILLLVITVYTVGSYAENGSNKITRNIHNGNSGYEYIGGNSRALNRRCKKNGFNKKPDFGICNGNERYKKNMFRRDPDVGLVFDSDPNLIYGLTRGKRTARQRIYSGIRKDIRLDSEQRMNDSLHLDASNRIGGGKLLLRIWIIADRNDVVKSFLCSINQGFNITLRLYYERQIY
ncbi:uncharacterized protein LOC143254190 [Tachypleus tridentatus]|uniref:uncharacterized protein LOC143254190 n=1 Tax=Tachypleus tridentatus TaxID=6853 RepID=UPI003FCF9B1F